MWNNAFSVHKIKYFLWHLLLLVDFFSRAVLIICFTPSDIIRRKRLVQNTKRISRKFIKAFRIQLTIHNQEGLEKLKNTPYLAVSNHVSYTDIILLAALENYVFITSVEMGNNPFLGQVTRCGGCLFTNRKKFVSLPKEIEKFAATIKQGFKVMLFPEGTSTNGDTIKDFRKSLFQTAILAKCPVLPICIKYKLLDNELINSGNRDYLYWYGEMDFAPHFMKLLGRRIEVEINVLDVVPYREDLMRQELSERVFTQIHTCYHKTETCV